MFREVAPGRSFSSRQVHPQMLAVVVSVLASGAQAWPWRPALQSLFAHSVLLQDPHLAPNASNATGNASNSTAPEKLAWTRSIRLAGGATFNCSMPDRRAVIKAKRSKDRVAARWAPLRHRCHAWKGAADTGAGSIGECTASASPDPSGGGIGQCGSELPPAPASVQLNEDGSEPIPWAYRVCFATEAMAWAPRPWSERLALGWYNEPKDEVFPNGSVALHYVNGTGNRSARVRCDCGVGPPEIVSWDISEDGRRHEMVLSLASCCAFRAPSGSWTPIADSFKWLTSPLQGLDCFLLKQGSWIYKLCPTSGTLTRFPASQVGMDVTKNPRADASAAAGESGQAVDKLLDLLKNAGFTELSEAGAAAEALLKPTAAAGGVEDERDALLGTGGSEPALVMAAPVDEGVGFTEDVEKAIDDSSVYRGYAMANVLATALGHRHRAVEVKLDPGAVCKNDKSRRNQAVVRWICPANWRKAAPERDGGHTALLAVEETSRCSWVIWMSSLLLCADERLLPPPVVPKFNITCVAPEEEKKSDDAVPAGAAGDAPVEVDAQQQEQQEQQQQEQQQQQRKEHQQEPSQMAIEADTMRMPSGPERLTEVGVRVGQVVENLYDGTRGVVVAWHLPPDAKLLEAAGWPADDTCHCLVMAGAGQLPVVGKLESGTLNLPGHISYVPQSSLGFVTGSQGSRAPLRLPREAWGNVFTEFDRSSFSFVPAKWIAQQYPDDVAPGWHPSFDRPKGAEVYAPSPVNAMQEMDALVRELSQAAASTHQVVTKEISQEIEGKRSELEKTLGEKLEFLKKLQKLRDQSTGDSDDPGLLSSLLR